MSLRHLKELDVPDDGEQEGTHAGEPTHNGKAIYRGGLAFEELGKTRAVDLEGNPITPPPADAVRAIKAESTRAYNLREQEWLLGAWSFGGLGYRALAHLFGSGALEFSDESMRAVAKKYGVDQSNLSKVCKQWETFFGVEIGHCRHKPKEKDPLAKHKKGKVKLYCRDCFQGFFVKSGAIEGTCPECKQTIKNLDATNAEIETETETNDESQQYAE